MDLLPPALLEMEDFRDRYVHVHVYVVHARRVL